MNYQKLANLVNSHAEALLAFESGDTQQDDVAVAEILNAKTTDEDATYKLTWNDFFILFGAVQGRAILNAIAGIEDHKFIVELMRPSEGGFDVTVDGFKELVDVWESLEAVGQAIARKIRKLARRSVSPAQKQNLGIIGDGHIKSLREFLRS